MTSRFLANIQRNGTFSVVPRIAGGELTPDALITIGTVAKKYKLYTKITGGQRIDMFGAKKADLPDIWEELVEAGFESGHAYGKALRTVKSSSGPPGVCKTGTNTAARRYSGKAALRSGVGDRSARARPKVYLNASGKTVTEASQRTSLKRH